MYKNLSSLICVFALTGSGYADTITIQNLPVAEIEDHPICYDKDTGKLGNCPTYMAVPVDCGAGESLQDAINQLPPYGQADLEISGVCEEDIFLTRSKTTLRSVVPANKASIKTLTEPFQIIGAKHVFLENVKVSDGFGGVRISDMALVSLNGTEITGNNSTVGLEVYLNSVAKLEPNNTIGPNGDNRAVNIFNGSNIEIWGENNALISSENADATIYMADANLGIWGTNPVINGPFRLYNNSIMEGSSGIVFGGNRESVISTGSIVRFNGATHLGKIWFDTGALYAYGGSSVGEVDVNLNSTAFISQSSNYLGGIVHGNSHIYTAGAMNGNLTVKPSASAEITITANLNGNTVYLCGIANDASSVDPVAEATGVVSTTCPPAPASSSAKTASRQNIMRSLPAMERGEGG